jgi:oligoendopeptidase F
MGIGMDAAWDNNMQFLRVHTQMGFDVDAALNSIKELFARLAKDYHRRNTG